MFNESDKNNWINRNLSVVGFHISVNWSDVIVVFMVGTSLNNISNKSESISRKCFCIVSSFISTNCL